MYIYIFTTYNIYIHHFFRLLLGDIQSKNHEASVFDSKGGCLTFHLSHTSWEDLDGIGVSFLHVRPWSKWEVLSLLLGTPGGGWMLKLSRKLSGRPFDETSFGIIWSFFKEGIMLPRNGFNQSFTEIFQKWVLCLLKIEIQMNLAWPRTLCRGQKLFIQQGVSRGAFLRITWLMKGFSFTTHGLWTVDSKTWSLSPSKPSVHHPLQSATAKIATNGQLRFWKRFWSITRERHWVQEIRRTGNDEDFVRFVDAEEVVDPILFPTLECQTSDEFTAILRFLPLLGNIVTSGIRW